MTKKEMFLNEFDNEKYNKLTVEVTVPNCPDRELIINNKPNFDGKKEYYKKAYNDNLELNSFNEIKIINYTFE